MGDMKPSECGCCANPPTVYEDDEIMRIECLHADCECRPAAEAARELYGPEYRTLCIDGWNGRQEELRQR